jgi:hypothetical protein
MSREKYLFVIAFAMVSVQSVQRSFDFLPQIQKLAIARGFLASRICNVARKFGDGAVTKVIAGPTRLCLS